MKIIPFIYLDGARGTVGINFIKDYSIPLQISQAALKIQISCMRKKAPFCPFSRNWLIGFIIHALLVQSSNSTHRVFFPVILQH